jgi:hypothetical protein
MDITYEHADWLLQRMSARYVDLDDSQKKALRTRLSGLHAWHRTQELPLYADLLDQTADRINRHLSPADIHDGARFTAPPGRSRPWPRGSPRCSTLSRRRRRDRGGDGLGQCALRQVAARP